MCNNSILISVCFYVLVATSSFALDYTPVKASPEVTLDKVQEVFGSNIETNDPLLRNLLLAIAMDHTSPNSNFIDQSIGIPYIIEKTPNFWVSRLNNNDLSVDVLVNNALLLLFSIEPIPNSEKAAFELLTLASQKGYWPSDYYIAETNLVKHLTRDYSEFSMVRPTINSDDLRSIAKDTMDRFNNCASIGFTPCQYRIGFWLANSEPTLEHGIGILRHAIRTTMADNRYAGALNIELVLAARTIVNKGEKAGLDHIIRQEYANIVNQYM